MFILDNKKWHTESASIRSVFSAVFQYKNGQKQSIHLSLNTIRLFYTYAQMCSHIVTGQNLYNNFINNFMEIT